MLSPYRWLMRSMFPANALRRTRRNVLPLVESLESRQLLTNIFSEGFEGAFPGANWTVVSSQGRGWDDNDNTFNSGSWCGFAADFTNGTDGLDYVNSMDTTMTQVVDLTNFRNVSLTYFDVFNTESGFDGLTVTISKGGISTTTALESGFNFTWTQHTVAVPEALWGQSGVSIQFKFHSDGSVIGSNGGFQKGVWVDDISLDGTLDAGFPTSTITVPQGTNLELNQFGNITRSDAITSAGDRDFYGLGIDTAGNYTFTVDGGAGFDAQLRIYDANGNALTGILDSTGSGGSESVTLNLANSGQACYLVVGGFTTSTGSYTLSVNGPSSSPVSEFPAFPTFTASDNSTISFAGDRDYFSFVAPADTSTLTLTLNNSANLDGVINLFDSSGVNLGRSDSGGSGTTETLSSVSITPGNTYVLMVSGFSMSEGSAASEAYDFVIDFNPDNVGNPPATISVPDGPNLRLNQFGDISGFGGSIGSTTEFDIYGFGVETTGAYTITAGNGIDTQLRVYDSNGVAIAATVDGDTQANNGETTTVNLTAGQTCYFVVGGFSTITGNYTVSVDGPPVSVAASSFPSPNYFLSGSDGIQYAGDRDYFNITAPVGTTTLTIIMNPSAGLDGVITLFDSTGVKLTQRDSAFAGGAETISSFAVTAGQNYYVLFSGFDLTEGSTAAENYSYSIDFGPDLVDTNVAPTIPAGQVLPIPENSATNTVVGTVVANDANSTAPNNTLTYQIISQSPSTQFSINSATGQVTYVGPGALNFEITSQYTISVKVTDGGAGFLNTTQNVTISVTDVNEAPTIPAGQTLQVLENSAVNTVVGNVTANDPDSAAPNNTLTYSIVSGNPSNPFSINSATGQVTVANPAALNFESSPQFTLQVKVTDGGAGSLNVTQSVVINLIDANDAPSIPAGQILSVPENSNAGATVGTVTASDPDTTAPNKTLSYSITGGNTNSAFTINPGTGAITVNNSAQLDFEATPSFNLTITVTDGGSLQANQGVTVNLTNVNEPPVIAAGQSFSLPENSPVATLAGDVIASDPDANKATTFSITGGNTGNAFVIDSSTGSITVNTASAINFETNPVFNLVVKATDSGNLTDTKTVTITLTDVNEAPTITAGQTFSLPENSAAGFNVGTVVASDPDSTAPNNSKTFSISGGNTGNAFNINTITGAISVNSAAAVDFETTPSFSLSITVTDGGSLTATQTVTVNLTNVNEAPVLGAPGASPTFVGKTKTPVKVFPTITVSDPDGATDLASITITVSIPAGKKKFDIISPTSAGALGSLSGSFLSGDVTITLNNGVTAAQVQNFLRSITFSSSKASLKTLTRDFTVSVTDKAGATSNFVGQTVLVRKK